MITNWKTSIAGIPALITAVFAVYQSFKTGDLPSKENWEIIGGALSFAWLAFQAKDKNVTGGTIPQTLEADIRVRVPEVITGAIVPLNLPVAPATNIPTPPRSRP